MALPAKPHQLTLNAFDRQGEPVQSSPEAQKKKDFSIFALSDPQDSHLNSFDIYGGMAW